MVHVRRRYLLVQHTLPAEGSVLSRKMPTKRKLPGSSLITGAYVLTFELRDGGVSVLVALHVQVRKEQQLQNTTKWRMKPLPVPKSNTVHFTLTPVSKNTPVDILAIDLMLDEDSPRRAHLVFKSPRDVHGNGAVRKEAAYHGGARRQRAALAEAERVFA